MNKPPITPATAQTLREMLVRTVLIALIVATVVTLSVRGGGVPAQGRDWWVWLARVAAVLWISVGGHYFEMVYLTRVLPRIARDQEPANVARWFMRLGARCAVWAVGGAVLWPAGLTTYRLMTGGGWPRLEELPLIALHGAAGLVAVELLGVHAVMALIGRPSVWSRRGGCWG